MTNDHKQRSYWSILYIIESYFQPLQQSLRRSKLCPETYAGPCRKRGNKHQSIKTVCIRIKYFGCFNFVIFVKMPKRVIFHESTIGALWIGDSLMDNQRHLVYASLFCFIQVIDGFFNLNESTCEETLTNLWNMSLFWNQTNEGKPSTLCEIDQLIPEWIMHGLIHDIYQIVSFFLSFYSELEGNKYQNDWHLKFPEIFPYYTGERNAREISKLCKKCAHASHNFLGKSKYPLFFQPFSCREKPGNFALSRNGADQNFSNIFSL